MEKKDPREVLRRAVSSLRLVRDAGDLVACSAHPELTDLLNELANQVSKCVLDDLRKRKCAVEASKDGE